MMFFFALLFALSSVGFSEEPSGAAAEEPVRVPPKTLDRNVATVSIQNLARTATIDPGWTKVTIVEQTGPDTYLVRDSSAQITLFLSVDELLDIELHPGQEIVVYGRVDISPVSPSKNELYAEKIFVPR